MPQFQTLIDSYPNIAIEKAVNFYRGQKLGFSIVFKNGGQSDVNILQGVSNYLMFYLGGSVMDKLDPQIIELVPLFVLSSTLDIYPNNNGKSFVEMSDGRVVFNGDLKIRANDKTVLYGEFEYLQ